MTDVVDVVLFVLGALLTLLCGWPVGWVLDKASPWEKVEAPSGVPAAKWNLVVKDSTGGAWIGRIETLLVYVLVLYAKTDAALAIGGWLAFKVASKWEAWSNVVKVPDLFDGSSQLDSLRARRDWASTLYGRFLIGTLLNVLTGTIVALVVLRYS